MLILCVLSIGEDYKLLIEKREEVRKTFHAKMIETSKVCRLCTGIVYIDILNQELKRNKCILNSMKIRICLF